ncbi:MAG: hypothetical protein AABX03_04585 [Nanoarchaeota archaeon]
MRLVIAKPTMPAFEGDLRSSIDALNAVKSELGVSGDSLRINDDLEITFGFQPIIRYKDLADLSALEKNLASSGVGDYPLALHHPYMHDLDKSSTVDLSRGEEGYQNLLKVVQFADNIRALSIAVHPNAVRSKEEISSPEYTYERRLEFLDRVIKNVLEAQSHAKFTSVDLENKPVPATTVDNENMIYTITFGPLEDLQRYVNAGGKITFDPCHYGITMRTWNQIPYNAEVIKENAIGIKNDSDHLRETLRAEHELDKIISLGYFREDLQEQHLVSDAMLRLSFKLGSAINHIHLNDGSIYRPVPETGRPNTDAKIPQVDGIQLYWEAYVPGYGELFNNSDIMPWLRQYGHEDRTVPLTIEVTEFDNNYKENPRFREGAVSLVKDILSEFS